MPIQRSVRVRTALGDKLSFHHMTGADFVSRPFDYRLVLASEDETLAFEDVLGTPVSVELASEQGSSRYFHGFMGSFAYLGSEGQLALYEATVRPWLWFLTRSHDCRIFQEQTAVDIIKAIFAKYPIADFDDRLSGSYPTRTYCVQYRESNFDFVSRLMEREGIFYFFEHSADAHTLVLADSSDALKSSSGYEDVPYFPPQEESRRERDHVYEWRVQTVVQSGSFVHTAFDFEKPRADLTAKLDQPMPHSLAKGEVYDYPGGHTELAEGDRIARLQLEAELAEYKRFAGAGTAAGLAPGCAFKLSRHPRDDQNKQYLLLEVAHEIWEPTYRSAMSGEEPVYLCRFQTMPADQAFRPPSVTPKPLIRGPQTAIVTGPSGEEIWTDKYGRVKVQFHWDREGKRDENSSCWIRVSQAWAGPGFGAMLIPRIGQEVIVDFLEGDPDRPIITGRVYNANAMPPYALPAAATQSGLKSNSSKGGGGANELRFEDQKGQEEVYFHAQKDHMAVVENDETRTVGNNRSRSVAVNEEITIGGNQTVSVAGNRTDTVSQNEARTVLIAQQQTVGAARNVTVGASQSHEVGANDAWGIGGFQQIGIGLNQDVGIGRNQSISVGSDQSTNVGKNRSVKVDGDQNVRVDKDATMDVGKELTINAGDQITIQTGKAVIQMKKDGTITIKGKDISIDGSGKITTKAKGNVVIKGKKVLEN